MKPLDQSLNEDISNSLNSNSNSSRLRIFNDKDSSDLELDKHTDISLTEETSNTSSNSMNRLRIFYEKDSLPPCLRARNLKNQLKTRSLDEEEFEKECGLTKTNQRRKSLDEHIG